MRSEMKKLARKIKREKKTAAAQYIEQLKSLVNLAQVILNGLEKSI